MRRIKYLACLVILALLACGCTHISHYGIKRELVFEKKNQEIKIFEYKRNLHKIHIKLIKNNETDDWEEYLIKFRVKDFEEGNNKYAKAFYYVQKEETKKAPCLIILPPTGGKRDFIKTYADDYAKKGFTIMAFMRREGFFKPEQTLEYNVMLFRQAVIDVRRAIDYFETRMDADSKRIAVMGVSLGGIITALAAEADPRIKAYATIVSSAYLERILETSGYDVVKKFRKTIKTRNKIENEEMAEYAAQILKQVDPATYADRIDPARILMINGYTDNIIKYDLAKATWKIYGKPKMFVTPFGHYLTIGGTDYTFRKTYEHFLEVLELEEDETGRVRPISMAR